LSLILTRPVLIDQLLHGKILGAAMIIASVLIIIFIGNILLFSVITGTITLHDGQNKFTTFTVVKATGDEVAN
jgi:ABC-type transport system involved in multi-copper enzyme maturation permease subunit